MGGHITEYTVPSPGFQGAILTGLDHALWFTENGAQKIARRAPDGSFTEYPLPNANSNPLGLTVGPDGALWFTESRGNRIGRITTSGQIREYPIPTPMSLPLRLTTGPDGAIWFTEGAANKIGRITMDGKITEYPAHGGAVGIVVGPDGALWYTGGVGSNMIGRITTDGAVTTYLTPTANSFPFQIAVGPDAALWFTEALGNKIGRLQLPATLARPMVTSADGSGTSASFTVSFTSSASGQGYVYFGPGPGCSGLVEVATQDLHPGTSQHTVVVTGNDLPGTVGDNGIQPGVTYWFEAVTVTRNGTEIDDNGGKCYSVAVPSM
jgi:virginiamycin B lyase